MSKIDEHLAAIKHAPALAEALRGVLTWGSSVHKAAARTTLDAYDRDMEATKS